MNLSLGAREQQGLAAREKGVEAGAQVSPAEVVHPPSRAVPQGPSQAEPAPCKSPGRGEGRRPAFRWAGPAMAAATATGGRAVACG